MICTWSEDMADVDPLNKRSTHVAANCSRMKLHPHEEKNWRLTSKSNDTCIKQAAGPSVTDQSATRTPPQCCEQISPFNLLATGLLCYWWANSAPPVA
jgi:hypothetical protein